MKKFYVNFITSSILYNQIYSADKNVKFEKGKLFIKYKCNFYQSQNEIEIAKDTEIDINFIINLVKSNKFVRFKRKENLVLTKWDFIEIKNKKNQNNNLKIEDCIFKNEVCSVIYLQTPCIFKMGSCIKIDNEFSCILNNKKVYLEWFNFTSQEEFKKSIFKVFNDLELRDYKGNIIKMKDQKVEDYYIHPYFYYQFTNHKELDSISFEKILKNALTISLFSYKYYNVKEIKLDKNLEKKYKIVNKYESKKLKMYKSLDYISLYGELKYKYNFKGINSIKINDRYTYGINEEINDDDIYIKITDIDNKKITDIVPKTAEIKIDSKENIFIIDKEKYKSKVLDFVEDNIDTDTVISDYIDKTYIVNTYPELKEHYDLKVEGGNGDKFEDGAKITVTIKHIIPDITTNKNQNKIYVKVKFEVSDNTKYKLKENILKLNNHEFELEKDSKYENLIEKVKGKLENTAFKDGFTVLYNNSDFTSGSNLINDGIYTFKLNNEDKNFVEENEKEVPKEDNKDNEEEHKNDEEEHKEDDEEQHNEHINNLTNINTNNGNDDNNNNNDKDTKKSNNGCKCCDYNKKSENN